MPTKTEVHIDSALTNLAIVYRNLQFVAEQIFPVVPVMKESDKYYIFGREEMRSVQTERALGAEAGEVDWNVTNAGYNCDEYSLRHLVPDRIMENADSPIRPKETAMRKLMDWIRLGYEKRVMALITGGSLSKTTPAIKWDGSSPTIEADIDTAKQAIGLNAGVVANIIMMNTEVKDVFKKDSTIRNLIRYTIQGNGGQELLVNGELPPVIFGLRPIIAGAAENTANKGATDVIARICPDDVLVAYVEPNPGIEAMSLGYTFRKGDWVVQSYREPKRKGDMIEPFVIQDEKIVASAAGYLLDNVLA